GGLVVALATCALLADYQVSRNRLEPDRADNRVVAELRAAGAGAGAVLGVPILGQAVTWNSVSTYLGAQSRRRVLNAYNQTPAPWQAERVARLAPLNQGGAAPAARAGGRGGPAGPPHPRRRRPGRPGGSPPARHPPGRGRGRAPGVQTRR